MVAAAVTEGHMSLSLLCSGIAAVFCSHYGLLYLVSSAEQFHDTRSRQSYFKETRSLAYSVNETSLCFV